MPERDVERISKYNLSGAVEDTYASKTAQNPTTSRRMKSLIPTPAGYLEREQTNALFAANALPSGVVWMFDFAQNIGGTVVHYYFSATTTTLFQLSGSPGSGTWIPVTAVGTLANIPIARFVNNLLHFSDGVSSFIFDGTNWIVDGLPIPQHAPTFFIYSGSLAAISITSIARTNGVTTVTFPANVLPGNYVTIAGVSDSTFNGTFFTLTGGSSFTTTVTFAQPGFPDNGLGATGTIQPTNFSVVSNRYYWTTFSDQSGTHPHESSSSPRSIGTGPFTNKAVVLLQRPGIFNAASGSANIIGAGTDFSASDIGMTMRQPNGPFVGIIASVQDSQHLTLTAPATVSVSAGQLTIAPARATHWNIYCSEAENSNVGFFLTSVPLTGLITTGASFDQSPFTNFANSYINTVLQRPIRNDPTTGTKIMAVHKRRIFRRNEQLPNFFNYTAFEEVKATGTGTAEECIPGHDPNTLSDLVNEQSYPEESRVIQAMVDHADALFIGTERSVIPLFGETIDDFVLSQVTAFSVGMAGRFSTKSTPHGLLFLSYDRKFYLWPQQWIPFYAPEETTTLIELSRPKRTTFQNILPSSQDQVWVEFYNYGKRNWAVVSFQSKDTTWHTYVFDFEVKGWFELQRGVQSLAVFEPVTGVRVLVGGGTDGFVYVLDDPSGFFATSGNLPAGIFRPAVIDYGAPDSKHINRYVEFELSNNAMANDLTVNYYLDPIDADNPGTPIPITMTQVRGANRWRGFFTGPALCERILIEFLVAASQNNGNILSITLAASAASKLIA